MHEGLGKKLKRARLAKLLTQPQVGEMLNLSKKTVSARELGTNSISEKELRRYADELGFEYDWFLDGDDSDGNIPRPKSIQQKQDISITTGTYRITGTITVDLIVEPIDPSKNSPID